MPVEVNAFKALVRTWLTGIEGIEALIADRAYCGRPMAPPHYPMITFALSRRPQTDFPLSAWAGELDVAILSPDGDDIDEIEDFITYSIAATTIETALSDAVVACHHFCLASIGPDEPVEGGLAPAPEAGALVVNARHLRFAFAIGGQEE